MFTLRRKLASETVRAPSNNKKKKKETERAPRARFILQLHLFYVLLILEDIENLNNKNIYGEVLMTQQKKAETAKEENNES